MGLEELFSTFLPTKWTLKLLLHTPLQAFGVVPGALSFGAVEHHYLGERLLEEMAVDWHAHLAHPVERRRARPFEDVLGFNTDVLRLHPRRFLLRFDLI